MDTPMKLAPDYRDSLANERTFLAWIRTGLSLDGFGFAVLQLFPDFGSSVTKELTGIALIVLGTVVVGTSFWQWRQNERAIREQVPFASSWLPVALAGGISVVTIAVVLLFVIPALI